MDPQRFQNSPSGRLVKVGRGQDSYWAFLPNPLPPEISMDSELVFALSDAAHALGELAGLGRNMANPYLLINPFIRREAVLSSRIEGTRTDIVELYAYEAGQLSLPGMEQPSESDRREVLNYVHAMEYGLKRLESLPVSQRFIREIHGELMKGVRDERARPGDFRTGQNYIGGWASQSIHDASFVPPPVDEMHSALAAFEKYLYAEGSDYPPLVRLALMHYQFEAIHPFIDGNGRVGRLLISLLLVHWQLLPHPLLYLSAYFDRHREQYYDLLLTISERGAWRDWVLFFLRGVAQQARDAGDRARKLQELQEIWRALLHQERISGLAARIIDFLFVLPIVSAPEVAQAMGVSHQAAMQALRKLERLEIVREVTGHKRNRIYVAVTILDIIK